MTKNTETTPTELQVGDLVAFNEPEGASRWQGGKGEVVAFNEYPTDYTVKVKTHQVPLRVAEVNGGYLEGTTNNFKPTDLLPYTTETEKPAEDAVVHPAHYGGGDNPYEVIKVAEAWGFDKDAYLFNVLKYIARAGKKGKTLEDHKKARFYLDRKIDKLEEAQ